MTFGDALLQCRDQLQCYSPLHKGEIGEDEALLKGKANLLQFSEFPSTNKAAACESQKVGMENQNGSTVLLLHCFLPQA